jgi:hypothetical protein
MNSRKLNGRIDRKSTFPTGKEYGFDNAMPKSEPAQAI